MFLYIDDDAMGEEAKEIEQECVDGRSCSNSWCSLAF